jgi:hypothetical protein
MNSAKGKFSFTVYLNLTLLLLLASITAYTFLHPEFYTKVKSKESKFLISLLLLFLSIIAAYSFAKRTFLVRIGDGAIILRGFLKTLNIRSSEIKSVNLFSAENLYGFAGYRTIATSIELESGKKVIITDSFYRNIPELKKALIENFGKKIILPQRHFNSHQKTEFETEYEKISGNPITSINGLMIIGSLCFIALSFTSKTHLVPAHLFLLFPLAIFYFGFGSQLYYFLISNRHLVIRNHCFPWVNKIYNLEEIILVNFEKTGKRSKSLRITTNDFKSKLYSAGSLREKHWEIIRTKLNDDGIPFLNVSYY